MKILKYETENAFDYENGYYLTCDNTRVPKVLAQYELYKKILDLPGAVVECGVFKGASLIRFACFREALEHPNSRKIIGFDAFGSFPRTNIPRDDEFAREHDEKTGLGISQKELERSLEFKGLKNIELVGGDLTVTMIEYFEKCPEQKIALLHVDVDVYVPTKAILEGLYGRVVTGGVFIFDDYGRIAGETQAVDEFFNDRKLRIQKFPFAHSPCYAIKE